MHTSPAIDDLVGLDLVTSGMTPQRRAHFFSQIGSGIPRPVIPAGLAPFLTLPGPEPRTLTRARMAATIAQLYPANGRVTDEDLLASGFTRQQITELGPEAIRISRVSEMVV